MSLISLLPGRLRACRVLNGTETADNDRHDRVRPRVPFRFGYARQRAQEENDVGNVNLFAHLASGFPPVEQRPERFIEPVVLA